ncbi:MAG: cobalamin-dependent protein, partial [Deltaproteobacteria bacterium]|nr:cobalamin-dependent protein [Deltaproteobacteria bacterium]
MRALLVYPEFPATFWSFKYALKFIHKRAALPPLGLLTIGAMLPKEWPKKLVDMNVMKLTEKDLAWADCVFISGMALQREAACEIIARCKEANLKVIAGGPLFTSEYDQFEGVDHFILNEAELTLPPFLADLEKGCAQNIYETSEFCDIRRTPAP